MNDHTKNCGEDLALTPAELQQLIKAATEARFAAYAPYSNFRVGAALLTTDSQMFTGCNIENASYGLANCAERTAVFKAVSEGKRDFKAIAVVGDSPEPCSPCGACRQVLVEFSPNMAVVLANPEGEFELFTAEELLPGFFGVQEDAAR